MTKKKNHTKEKSDKLLDALTDISKMQADIIRLTMYEGHSIAQVAARMRISVDRARNEESVGYRNLFHIAIDDPDRSFFDQDPRGMPGK